MSASAVTTVASAPLQVHRVPCRPNNYAWIVHEPQAQVTAVVDTPELEPIVAALDALGLRLDVILNTHHHMDHVGGNLELKRRFGCKVVGPKADEDRIPGIDTAVGDGDVWRLGALDVHVLDTPGHTRGHITYHVPQAEALFPGDTLFLMGCGRLFEGTPGQMWSSLQKLMPLPPSTKVYCAHEYTHANAQWALHVDPENLALQQRAAQVEKVRARGEATVPGILAEELETNPFLRPSDPRIRRALEILDSTSDADAFAAIRAHKDSF